jgi:hypothetical protein
MEPMSEVDFTVVCNECGGMWKNSKEWEEKDPCLNNE